MGDLLGQMDLLLTRKEEADRPGAGVGEGATLRVIVHLGGEGHFRGQRASSCHSPDPQLRLWAQRHPVELPLMLDCLPLHGKPLSSVISPSPHSTTGRSELSLPAPQRGRGSRSER